MNTNRQRVGRIGTLTLLALVMAAAAAGALFGAWLLVEDMSTRTDKFDGLGAAIGGAALALAAVVIGLGALSWRLVKRDHPVGYCLALLPGLIFALTAISMGTQLPDSAGPTASALVATLVLVPAPLLGLLAGRSS